MRMPRRGFTLIELLVAVALMVILTGVVVFVFSKAVQVFMIADARAQIFQNVRSGVDLMRRDLMSASPMLKDDATSSNQQRLRIENATYNNTKWSTDYPADVLKVWNAQSADVAGNTSSVYVKYWLDHAANKEVPILKRHTRPVDSTATAAGGWANTATNDLAMTGTSDLVEELMQYVVGLDVEPYYPNSGTGWNEDPFWCLDADANASPNNFRDATNASAAQLFIVKYNPTTTTDIGAINALSGVAPNCILDISSIPTATTDYYRRALFAPSGNPPTAGNQWGTATTYTAGRAVGPLPRGLRLTFYVRDERSREQRAIQEVIMIPCWGS